MSVRATCSNLYQRLRHPGLRRSFDIASHLTLRERVELFRLAARPGVRHVAEIGSYLGASAAALALGLVAPGKTDARLVCIDTWHNDGMSEGARDTMAVFLRNLAWTGPMLSTVRGNSAESADEVACRLGQVDLLFIDGDHSYAGCLADWRAYAPLMAGGGIVAFHDIGWAEGVQRVVREEVMPRATAEFRLQNLWWGQLA